MIEPDTVLEDVASAMPANGTGLLKDTDETTAENKEDEKNGIQQVGGDVTEEEIPENVKMKEQDDVREGKDSDKEENVEEGESAKIEKENDVKEEKASEQKEKEEESEGRNMEEEGDKMEKGKGGEMGEEDHEKEVAESDMEEEGGD